MDWRRRLDPNARFGLRLTLFAAAVVLVAVPFGLLLAQVTRAGPLTELDTSAANHLPAAVRRSGVLVAVLQVVTFLGSPVWFYGVVGPAVGWLVWRHRLRLAVYLAVTTLGGGAVGTVVKVLVDRDRPSLVEPVATAHGQSFPSGHAMTSAVAYGALYLVFAPALPARWRRPVLGAAVALVLLIGATRLALGVHYVTDVLGGLVLGAAWLAGVTAAFAVWRLERGGRPADALHDGIEPEAARDLVPGRGDHGVSA